MLLRIKGLKFPERFIIHSFSKEPATGPMDFMDEVSPGLVPLEDTLWPDEVKAKVVEIFKKIGVEAPLQQKLVEPYVKCFGGKEVEGEAVLDGVNWTQLIDFFKFEAKQWTWETEADLENLKSIQERAEKKYGDFLNHRYFYGESY